MYGKPTKRQLRLFEGLLLFESLLGECCGPVQDDRKFNRIVRRGGIKKKLFRVRDFPEKFFDGVSHLPLFFRFTGYERRAIRARSNLVPSIRVDLHVEKLQ